MTLTPNSDGSWSAYGRCHGISVVAEGATRYEARCAFIAATEAALARRSQP
jgi:hypothetical protein